MTCSEQEIKIFGFVIDVLNAYFEQVTVYMFFTFSMIFIAITQLTIDLSGVVNGTF